MRTFLARTHVNINGTHFEPGETFRSEVDDKIRYLLEHGNIKIIG